MFRGPVAWHMHISEVNQTSSSPMDRIQYMTDEHCILDSSRPNRIPIKIEESHLEGGYHYTMLHDMGVVNRLHRICWSNFEWDVTELELS